MDHLFNRDKQSPNNYITIKRAPLFAINATRSLLWGLIITLAALCSSCRKTDSIGGGIEERTKIRVSLRLLAPAPIPIGSSSRSQTEAEGTITQLAVLVFENGNYQYTAMAQNLNSLGGVTTLTTDFYTTDAPVEIYFAANADNIILANPLVIGDSQATVTQKLTTSFTSSGINRNFPMFGVYSSSGGLNNNMSNIAVTLLRNVARIDIDARAVSSNFKLASVEAFRANSTIQLIPNTLSGEAVTAPSIPAGSTTTIHTTAITPTTTESSSTSQLYLPESVAPTLANQQSDATCIVVGGYFKGSSTITYYRMDFNLNLGESPFGQILRNYAYLFSINTITIPGASTPTEAANNIATGITAQVSDWDANSINVDFQGNSYFGVSSRTIALGSAKTSIAEIAVNTNVTDYTMQFASAEGVGIGSPATSLANTHFKVEQVNGNATIRFTALLDNLSGTTTDYVLISAREMRILLTINQSTFKVTPNPIIISASGGVGYALVTSTSSWGTISNQSWLSPTAATVDTLKWSATPNPETTIRTGNLLVNNLNGEQVSIPFQQKIPNNKVLNVYSLRSGFAYLGAGTTTSTADRRGQGLKGILTRATNFGLAGTVNMNSFNFSESTTLPHTLNATVLANINILYLNLPGGPTDVNAAGVTAVSTWLNGDSKRVLIIGCDLNYNAAMLTALGVTSITYYVNPPAYQMQFNVNTQYFSNTGPFTSYPIKPITNPFSFRNFDGIYSEINTTIHTTITPILKGNQGNSVLGIDYNKRVIYVGDIDLFNPDPGVNPTTNNFIQNTTGVINSDASKLIANVWAWAANTALGVTP